MKKVAASGRAVGAAPRRLVGVAHARGANIRRRIFTPRANIRSRMIRTGTGYAGIQHITIGILTVMSSGYMMMKAEHAKR